ncbi:MAG: hypothetical protein IPL52_05940 [Flavobacteriales bacterium]|nr:hypothetical protein [Flavobacteriales bacterium]
MSVRLRFRAMLLFALLVVASACVAQHDTITLNFRHLSIKDGLSQGMVHRMIQDRHGFMWFATKDGLNRYDGYSFKVYRHDPADPGSLCDSYVQALMEDRTGLIWVGTATGLDVFDRNTETFHHIPCANEVGAWTKPRMVPAIPGTSIASIALDHAGHVWASTRQGVIRIDAPTLEQLSSGTLRITWAIANSGWSHLLIDQRGILRSNTGQTSFALDTRDLTYRIDTLHIDATPYYQDGGWKMWRTNLYQFEDTVRNVLYGMYQWGVMRIDPDNHQAVTLREFPELGLQVTSDGMAVGDEGQLWLPTQGGQCIRFDPVTRHVSTLRAEAPELNELLTYVKCIYRDRNGLIWMGTAGYGILTYDPRVERFHAAPGPSIRYMVPGVNGRIVMNEGNFLTVFDPVRRAYELRIGIQEARKRTRFNSGFWGNDAVVQDRKGAFWLSKGGLVRYDHGQATLERVLPGDASAPNLPINCSAFPLRFISDTLWFGVDSGLHWFDPHSGRFQQYRYPVPPVNNPYLFLQVIHRDSKGIFWLGTLKGLYRFDPRTEQWTLFRNDPNDPTTLAVDVIFSILPDPHDPDGVLWIGTNGGGLNRFETATGHVSRYTTKEGLPNDVVYGVLSDDSGRLWMSTNKGIARLDPATSTFRNFTARDGLQNDEFNRYAYCKLADGTLCFGGVSGINTFRPRDLEDDTRPVTVIITDIKLRNRSIDFRAADAPLSKPPYESTGMEIPFSDNMVTFEFATMEFAAPGSHRYQYKLEGFDRDWIMVGTEHMAVYTNLDPGSYTFLVKGSNRDNYWAGEGTTFRLVVLPPWWRTWWFYALCAITIAGGVLLYIGSLRRTVRIRTRQLRHEKERSEDLLNNILPAEVADELKRQGSTEASYMDEVTVLFTDFMGFTRISEQMDADELVAELNVCFKAFDRIAEKHHLEKIKTIGDAYLCVGGLPKPLADAARKVVLAALEMQAFMVQRKAERLRQGLVAFDMRAGIHTGPLVAGVVGLKKFQYDIWGDTVDIAHRMESECEVGQVNISEATYRLVAGTQSPAVGSGNVSRATDNQQLSTEPAFTFTPRGKLQAKGKGEMEMYLVSRTW